MRLTLWIVSLCLLPMLPALAEQKSMQDHCVKADELYECGDFEGAYVLYKVQGNKTAADWYNMGNAAFKNNKFIQAIACWYRAIREGGTAYVDDCSHNITIAYTKMGLKQPQSWVDMVMKYASYPSLLFFQMLFLLLWYLMGISWVLLRGSYRIFCVSFLVVCLSANTAGLIAARSFWSEDTCIVCNADVPLHVGPDSRFMVTHTVGKALRARIVEQRDGWYNITTDEVSGWVSAEHIALV